MVIRCVMRRAWTHKFQVDLLSIPYTVIFVCSRSTLHVKRVLQTKINYKDLVQTSNFSCAEYNVKVHFLSSFALGSGTYY